MRIGALAPVYEHEYEIFLVMAEKSGTELLSPLPSCCVFEFVTLHSAQTLDSPVLLWLSYELNIWLSAGLGNYSFRLCVKMALGHTPNPVQCVLVLWFLQRWLWRVISWKSNRRFRGTCRLHSQGQRISSVYHLYHSGSFRGLFFDPEDVSNMCSSEMSVDFQWSSWRYIPDNTFFYPCVHYKNIIHFFILRIT
jgi:hypothetical protein